MDGSFHFVNEAQNSVVVFHVKKQGNPQTLSQPNLSLSQLKEFHQQTGFAAFLRLAVMTAVVEGMPHLARRASSLKTNHQLRRSCGLEEQVWQTTMQLFWMENSTACPERCVGISSSTSPCTPISGKHSWCCSLVIRMVIVVHCGWNPALLIQLQRSYGLQKDQDRSTEAARHTKGKALATHKWLNQYKIWDVPRIVKVEN